MPLEVVCHPRICLSLEQVDLVNKHATYGILSIGCHGDAFHVVQAIHDDLFFSLQSHGCTAIALIVFFFNFGCTAIAWIVCPIFTFFFSCCIKT